MAYEDPTSPAEAGLLAVERGLSELRAGRPVAVTGPEPALVAPAEAVDAALAARLGALAAGRARLVLPAPRLRRLGLDRAQAGAVALPLIDTARLESLALRVDARIDAPVGPVSEVDEEALELLSLALLLPAALVVPLDREPPADLLRVPGAAVRAYRGAQARRIAIVSRAPVPLEGARDTEFVVFRGGEGLRDQVAIIVGRPDLSRPVAVRLHSACLTGDLFGSLKCDCGDQLRDTVRGMAAGEGGILLYLDQEGRGNGLANKIRAYGLQARGFDTYEADEVLGFGLDQRRFD
ncbi:GTP cyclohydrolase, partial [Salinarimonas soli]